MRSTAHSSFGHFISVGRPSNHAAPGGPGRVYSILSTPPSQTLPDSQTTTAQLPFVSSAWHWASMTATLTASGRRLDQDLMLYIV